MPEITPLPPIVIQVKQQGKVQVNAPSFAAGESRLAKLLDVTVANQSNGAVLYYNSANGDYEFSSIDGERLSIQIRRSSIPGEIPSSLANGELFLNFADQLLYYKHSNGSIITLANGASTGSDIDLYARAHSNAAYTHTNTAYDTANTAVIIGLSAFDRANSGIITAFSAYDKANSANIFAQVARDQANAAYERANTANIVAASAYVQANIATTNADAAFVRANAAYANANTAIYTAAQIRANLSNTAPINYDSSTGVISHAISGVGANGYGDELNVSKIVVDDKGHITSATNKAIQLGDLTKVGLVKLEDSVTSTSTSNAATPNSVNTAYTLANTADVIAQAAFDFANTIQFAAASVGLGRTYYLDSVISQTGNNFTLLTTASRNVEEIRGVTVAGNTRFIARFVANTPVGVQGIEAGEWSFQTWANVAATGSTPEILTRMNKRVVQNTGTITSVGSGVTRSFRVYGNAPFVASDANTDLLVCSLIETPNETFSILTFANSSSVTANVTTGNTAYVNEDNVAFSIIYLLFPAVTTGTLTSTAPLLYPNNSTQPSFSFNVTDKLVAGYYARTPGAAKTPKLFFGGTQHYSHIDTPLTIPHNQLTGLQGGVPGIPGEQYHLTANEYSKLAGSYDTANSAFAEANVANTLAQTAFTAAARAHSGQIFYLDPFLGSFGNNFTLLFTPSQNTEISLSRVVAANTRFIDRFVAANGPGVTTIPAGEWSFQDWVQTSNNSGTTEVLTRINKRVDQPGTITSTGSGATRTFTVYGAAPFVASDSHPDILKATILLTPNATFFITAITSTSIVTAKEQDSNTGFANQDNVSYKLAYLQFPAVSSGPITTTNPFLLVNTQIQQAISFANTTDRLLAGYFARTDNPANVNVSVIIGGTLRYTRFESAIPESHNRLAFLQGGITGEQYHLTATEYSKLGPSYDQANAAYTRANNAYANANTAIYTAAQIRSNISNTAPINYDPTTGIISHALSGAVASGYGDAATVAKVIVDSNGHVTSVTNTVITISTAAITSGTLAVARGGTGQTAITVNGSLLIGNTVSGGFDVNPLTQGTGIAITNDKGSITIAATGGSAIDQYARDKANGAAQNAFITLNVAGQSDIVADSNTDTLTVVAGSGILITTDAATDTLTISATGGAATDQFARDKANLAFNLAIALS